MASRHSGQYHDERLLSTGPHTPGKRNRLIQCPCNYTKFWIPIYTGQYMWNALPTLQHNENNAANYKPMIRHMLLQGLIKEPHKSGCISHTSHQRPRLGLMTCDLNWKRNLWTMYTCNSYMVMTQQDTKTTMTTLHYRDNMERGVMGREGHSVYYWKLRKKIKNFI